MMQVAVLVPVLGRPHRVKPLLDSFEEATPPCYEVFFIADNFDHKEIEAIQQDGRGNLMIFNGNYAQKINHGVANTDHPMVLIGADDLEPQPHWLEAASDAIDLGAQVVGVNDLIPRSRTNHTTHFLVTREYANRGTIDNQPGVLYEGYTHWFVDDELIATATKRNVYTYARDSHVKHIHPDAGLAPDDDTYRKGRKEAAWDHHQFHQRVPLWT